MDEVQLTVFITDLFYSEYSTSQYMEPQVTQVSGPKACGRPVIFLYPFHFCYAILNTYQDNSISQTYLSETVMHVPIFINSVLESNFVSYYLNHFYLHLYVSKLGQAGSYKFQAFYVREMVFQIFFKQGWDIQLHVNITKFIYCT